MSGVNIADVVTNSAYTSGSTAITTIPGPTGLNPWDITAWSITFQGWVYTNALAAVTAIYSSTRSLTIGPVWPTLTIFGRLGQLWAGVLPTAQPTRGTDTAQQVPWAMYNSNPLPANSASLSKLWDGSTDDFPIFSGSGGQNQGGATLTISNNLNSPIRIQPGQQPAMGLWLLPSLICGSALPAGGDGTRVGLVVVTNTQYSVTYDDAPALPITTA